MLVKPLLLAQLQQSLNTVPSAALYIRESLPGSHILISHFQSKIVTARNVTLVAVAAGAQGRAALRAPPAAASEEGTSISQHDGIAAVNSISSGAAARRSLQAQDGSSSSTLFIRVGESLPKRHSVLDDVAMCTIVTSLLDASNACLTHKYVTLWTACLAYNRC
jgi:hypothetical protein